ncbi:hypothetical protein ACOME3_003362 [Neoechinorhynchus agilis]
MYGNRLSATPLNPFPVAAKFETFTISPSPQPYGPRIPAVKSFTKTEIDNVDYAHSPLGERIQSDQEFIGANPTVVKRELPATVYRQNISVRYLKPPTPEPEVVIIKEVREEPRELPPKIIRQRQPAPRTPSPIIIREKPPTPPVQKQPKVILKYLSPDPPTTRRVIIEKYDSPPVKPRDIIIERWLPYSKPETRTVVHRSVQKGPVREPIIVGHKRPTSRFERELVVDGVIKTDPDTYLRRYGDRLVDVGTIRKELDHMGFNEVLQIADDRLDYNLGTQNRSKSFYRDRKHHRKHRSSSYRRVKEYEVNADEDINEILKKLERESNSPFSQIKSREENDASKKKTYV